VQPEEYAKLAGVEDAMWYFRALHAHVERELKAALGARPAKVLDAGCGTGGLIRRLAARVPAWQWTGVDVSPLACALARQRCTAEIVEAQVESLPFAEGSFDAAVSADVLYHLDDDGAALRELRRVLRPGGALVVNVPAYAWLWSYHDVATGARRRYARSGLCTALRAAGFTVERATHWNALVFPLVVAKRKLFSSPRDTSDVRLASAPVEASLNGLASMERAWLRLGGQWAWGSSVLVRARRSE
jgi:SAM-dependent methyltransferase